jgi:ABC-type antimicrobial peptide transport system permease subunit
MAYSVAERQREIGIRVALGATPPAVFLHVLGEAMRVALAALVLGGVASYFLTGLIRTMLFGVSPIDAVTYLGVWLSLTGVAVLAGYLPARRAAHVDPIAALKES